MAVLLKVLDFVLLPLNIVISYYLSTGVLSVLAVMGGMDLSKLPDVSSYTVFNFWVFIPLLLVSLFIFAFVWCFANIADAAKKNLMSYKSWKKEK